jgi:glycosyltransferase involved in cell wall biosynthesis
MKIAYFTYTTLEFGGGVANYFTDTTVNLKHKYKDLDIDIVTFNERSLKVILDFYNIYFLGLQDKNIHKENLSNIKRKLKNVGYFKESIFTIKKRLLDYDFIYSSNNLLEVLLLAIFTWDKNFPDIIIGFHIPTVFPDTPSLQSKLHNLIYNSRIYRMAIAKASKLHVLNEFDFNFYSKYFPNKVYKIFNPFDFNKFEKLKTSGSKLKSKSARKNILWVGRLTEQKGIKELLNLIAFCSKKKYFENAYWQIIGDGELRKEVEMFAKNNNNIDFRGYIEHDKLPKLYSDGDLFVSTSKWESLPNNLLEAQCFGLPVVCFDINGCKDIIENDKNGFLVHNLETFREKIIHCLDGNIKKEFVRKFIRNKFKQNDIYDSLRSLFNGD